MIFSTDFSGYGKEHNYCRFNTANGAPAYSITIPKTLAKKAGLGEKCVLGYDEKKSVFFIIPNNDGDVTVNYQASPRVCAMAFMKAIGISPVGRYEAEIENGAIKIYLNKKVWNGKGL